MIYNLVNIKIQFSKYNFFFPNLIYIMLYKPKKSSVRNTQVGQAVNNSSVRKVGQMVKKPLFIKK